MVISTSSKGIIPLGNSNWTPDSTPKCEDDLHTSTCNTYDRVLRAAKVTKAPILVSEHKSRLVCDTFDYSCRMDLLTKEFMELEYEFSITTLEASEYSAVQPQTRVILIASKIGLPAPSDFLLFRF